MISEIITEDYIILNIHMEQSYTDFLNYNSDFNHHEINNSFNCMKVNDFSYGTIDRIIKYKKGITKKLILDFRNEKIIGLQNNMGQHIKECFEGNVFAINICDELKRKLDLAENKILNEGINYYDYLESECFKQITNIIENQTYECANGIILSKYINIKKIIENNDQLFKWCYLLCEKLYNNGIFSNLNKSRKPVLLAHTLNGICIATMISKLLNLEMIYIDHLGAHNRIMGSNFLDNYDPYQNYLLVVDFICQGNEILRAQNIIQFIGGNYIGFIGIMKLNISNVNIKQSKDHIIKETVMEISPEDAVKKIKYTIKTKLDEVE